MKVLTKDQPWPVIKGRNLLGEFERQREIIDLIQENSMRTKIRGAQATHVCLGPREKQKLQDEIKFWTGFSYNGKKPDTVAGLEIIWTVEDGITLLTALP